MSLNDWRSLPRKPRPDLAERNRQSAKHGLSGSGTRKSWEAMVRRCTNSDDKDFPRYGGRGISVCERWLSFEAFVADMGVRPDGLTIGRIDNDGNYEPGNCRWETFDEQNNNRRSNRSVTFDGRTQTIAQWAREAGISRALLRYRLNAGWSLQDALNTKPQRRTDNAENHAGC